MSTTPSRMRTRLLLLAELHTAGHHHADMLEVLAEHLVELVGDLLRLPATITPHPRNLLRVLEDRVRIVGAPEDLAVDVARALGGEERDERGVQRGVLLRRRFLPRPLEQA